MGLGSLSRIRGRRPTGDGTASGAGRRLARYALALSVLATGVAASAVASQILDARDRAAAEIDFQRRAAEVAAAVRSALDVPLAVLEAIPARFESAADPRGIGRAEFRAFVQGALARHRSLSALEWVPLVPAAERAAYEAQARADGLQAFRFTELYGEGVLGPAGERPEYLPIWFMEPPDRGALGFDLLSEPVRRATCERARDDGGIVVSARFRLVEDPPGVYSVAIYWPVYREDASARAGGPAAASPPGGPGAAPAPPAVLRPSAPATVEARRRSFRGFAIAILRLGRVVEQSLRGRAAAGGLELSLVDDFAGAGEDRLLFAMRADGGAAASPSPSPAAGAGRAAAGDDGARDAASEAFAWSTTFPFGDRAWTVAVRDGGGPRRFGGRAALALFGGIAASAGLAGFTLVAQTILRLRRQVDAAQRLGQYTLVEKLGQGGMGVVYKARHALLRRPTVLKLVQEDGGPERIARFEREVQRTSQLAHPNTILVYDYGRTPEGVFYYAMEYLDGLTFDELVALDGPQPPGRVVHLLDQALGALAEAHGVGLIHRDIKPANLMLVDKGGIPDFVKVLDFGLVKDDAASTGGGAPRPEVSTHGGVVGTPAYMSPEAVEARADLDQRADLYGVGAVAYYLLTGRLVFEGSAIAVMSQHLHAAPRAPSERLGSALPRGLDALVLSCLAKDPAGRPASATALREALSALAVPPWTEAEARRWWSERAPDLLAEAARRRAERLERVGQATPATGPERAPIAHTFSIDVMARVGR